jgi:hypothetical protein
MQRGKLYLSVGEEEIVKALVQNFGVTEIEAVDHVVKQKRELAFIHEMRGNTELAEQLMKELGED